MKVVIHETPKALEACVPKKDFEEMIVETETPGLGGGWARFSNGWVFAMSDLDDPKLPITVDAVRVSTGAGA